MSSVRFRYILETENKNGLKETTAEEFDKSELIIGRGPGTDLRLSGRRMSLQHARLVVRDDGLSIEDLDSLSGILVNDRLVKRQELKRGDKVKVGSFEFTVIFDEGWGFLERRDEKVGEQDLETVITGQEKKLRFANYLPSYWITSAMLSLLIAFFYFAAPISGTNRSSWNSGPISNAHKMIETECSHCHLVPFKQVQDDQCLACHKLSDHSGNLPVVYKRHPDLNMRCATCHMEHNGDHGIIASESKLCAECHGRIDDVLPESDTPAIDSFASHTEFRVTIRPQVLASNSGAEQDENDEEQAKTELLTKRVAIGDKANLIDNTQIKLNHRVHLQEGLAGADGPLTLSCQDCHRLQPNLVSFKPIKFERDCESCHSLEFDERLPGQAVPHGKSDVVYNYLYAEYAKLFLEKDGVEQPAAAAVTRRRLPGGNAQPREEKVEFSRTSVEEQARSTEEALFTRTACHLCHMMTEREDTSGGRSKYDVNHPNIPELWMPASRYDHGAHQEVSCESCHTGVRTSKDTTDVMLPGIANCRQCHMEEHQKGKVVSECITCHSFHESLEMGEEEKRQIEKILLSLSHLPFFNGG